MSADVISHHAPRRKRAGVLFIALAGVIAVSWLAALLHRPLSGAQPSSALATRSALPPASAPAPSQVETDVAADLAEPQRRHGARAATHPSGIPLDANGVLAPAGYEILSPAELDNISQARD